MELARFRPVDPQLAALLQENAEEMSELESKLLTLRHKRDRLVVSAYTPNVRMDDIAPLANLSKAQVHRIVKRAKQ